MIKIDKTGGWILSFEEVKVKRSTKISPKVDIKLDKNNKTTILRVVNTNQKQTMNGGVFTHEKLLNFVCSSGSLQWSCLGLLAPLLPAQ